MTLDWKQQFANDAEQAILHKMAQREIDELLVNLRSDRTSLPYYGILKACTVVAQVARAQALGIDPDLLRMTGEEAAVVARTMAHAFDDTGKPVVVVVNDE